MKIIYDKNKCINCGSCAVVCPAFWEMSNDGKATLSGAKASAEANCDELETDDKSCHEEAVNICPVQAIRII